MDRLRFTETASYMLNVSEDIVCNLFHAQNVTTELFPTLPVCGDKATPKEVSAKLKTFKELVMAE